MYCFRIGKRGTPGFGGEGIQVSVANMKYQESMGSCMSQPRTKAYTKTRMTTFINSEAQKIMDGNMAKDI